MSVYETLDYREFVRGWVTSRPGGGRGLYRKMAESLGVSTTLVSQVLSPQHAKRVKTGNDNTPLSRQHVSEKHFSMENAVDLAEFMALGERETEQFLLLVEHARAGSFKYRERLKRRIQKAQASAQKLSERLEKDRILNDHESATYYADWTYTAITHLIACESTLSLDQLSDRLHLPRPVVAKSFSFLVETGILIAKPSGGYDVGPTLTHLGSDSPLVNKHHQNWRLKGFSQMIQKHEDDLFYTAPMSLSHETAKQIRAELPAFIERIVKLVGPSPSQTVRCLNLDWFTY